LNPLPFLVYLRRLWFLLGPQVGINGVTANPFAQFLVCSTSVSIEEVPHPFRCALLLRLLGFSFREARAGPLIFSEQPLFWGVSFVAFFRCGSRVFVCLRTLLGGFPCASGELKFRRRSLSPLFESPTLWVICSVRTF